MILIFHLKKNLCYIQFNERYRVYHKNLIVVHSIILIMFNNLFKSIIKKILSYCIIFLYIIFLFIISIIAIITIFISSVILGIYKIYCSVVIKSIKLFKWVMRK